MPKSNAVEAYVSKYPKRQFATVSKEVIADLKKFAKYAKKGRPTNTAGLRKFMRDVHGLELGRTILRNTCTSNGIEPWFSA